MSQDPSGLNAGPNPYEYCGNGPTDGTDPSGEAVYLVARQFAGEDTKASAERYDKYGLSHGYLLLTDKTDTTVVATYSFHPNVWPANYTNLTVKSASDIPTYIKGNVANTTDANWVAGTRLG